MSNWKFGSSSCKKLGKMHPDLQQVFGLALELSPYDFGITQSLRSVAEQQELIDAGSSWTRDSAHLEQPDGWCYAGDIVVYKSGGVTWEEGAYRKVMQAFVTAAIELGVHIELGGLWESVFDGPHIELNRKYYK